VKPAHKQLRGWDIINWVLLGWRGLVVALVVCEKGRAWGKARAIA